MARDAGLRATPWPICSPTTGHRQPSALVRLAEADGDHLFTLLFHRYPSKEWATFARCGWRETSTGLIITVAALDPPLSGELNEDVDHVSFSERYIVRTALEMDHHPLAIAVIHSHPEGFETHPSSVDDDMDEYYSRYFSDFGANRPYISLIFGRDLGGTLSGTGRVWWKGSWLAVARFAVRGQAIALGEYEFRSARSARRKAQTARLTSAMGEEAAERLARATVAVIGAGGTGSPTVEVLARAGVGHIVTVDPDCFEPSNLERVHGSGASDSESRPSKVAIARRHVASINPECVVTAIVGALPQQIVVDALASADVAIGCTDQEHSRLALSDCAIRYLVPSIDVGVSLESSGDLLSGQIIQLVRLLPTDPCVYCQGMIRSWAVAQELMPQEERIARRENAAENAQNAEIARSYWTDVPTLNTVGYLTTIGGAMAAGYAIGWITQRFVPPFEKLQLNLSGDLLDVTNQPNVARSTCACRRMKGMADQGNADAFLSAPEHWQRAEFHESLCWT